MITRIFLQENLPSVNNPSQWKKTEIQSILREHYQLSATNSQFQQEKLWVRIFFFEKQKRETHKKDLHNIVKPLLDVLRGYVYEDDRQIVYLELTKIDTTNSRNKLKQSIQIRHDSEYTTELADKYLEAFECVWIEIGELPPKGKRLPLTNLQIDWHKLLS